VRIDLSVHVADVVSLINHNNLKNVVLLGHSYGGMVISGVAAQIPERIAHLVFLDAVVPRSGENHFDTCDPEQAANLRRLIDEQGAGVKVPALASGLEYFGVTDPEDVAWVSPRLSDQPADTFREHLGDITAGEAIPRTFIRCTRSALVSRLSENRARAEPFRFIEIDADHDVMVTDPALLANLLKEIVDRSAPQPRLEPLAT
jgi:pimeloyl-ACP methyl ester carboxylesterase